MDKIANKPLSRIKTLPDFYENKILTFLEFLEIISNQPIRQLDIHWCPQSYLIGYSNIKYNFIGRFEHFSEDLDFVLRKILSDTGDSPDLYIKKEMKHSTNASMKLKEFLNDQTIAIINKMYKMDFENFSYPYL